MDRSSPWAWGHQVWWGSQGGKKKREGLSQEAPRENKRSLKVCTSVLFSFFFFFTMKDSRLEDLWIVTVFCKAREKLGNRGWVQKAPVGGQQTHTEVC